MTVVKAVYIAGCKERWGPTVIVDPEFPEKTGQSFDGGPPFCYEEDNHLGRDVELKAVPMGRLYKDSEGRKTSAVRIICNETACPMHKEFSPTPSGPDASGKQSST